MPTCFNTNTNGQRLHFGEETIAILDMAPSGKWATAGFDVLIVCVSSCVCVCVCEIYTIKIEAYWWNKSISDREEMEMVEKTQGIKDMEGESAAILRIQAGERGSGWHVGSQLNKPWLAAVRGHVEAFRLLWPGLGIPCVCTCGVNAVICIS